MSPVRPSLCVSSPPAAGLEQDDARAFPTTLMGTEMEPSVLLFTAQYDSRPSGMSVSNTRYAFARPSVKLLPWSSFNYSAQQGECSGPGRDPRVHVAKTNSRNPEDQIVLKEVRVAKEQSREFPDTRINVVVDITNRSEAPTSGQPLITWFQFVSSWLDDFLVQLSGWGRWKLPLGWAWATTEKCSGFT